MNKVNKLLTVALLCPLLGMAAPAPDDFDDFMKDSMKEFDTFISDADKAFIDFMRHPWKKYDGEKPKKKRIKPEPPEMPVFNPSAPESNEPPKQLTIQEILDLTTKESRKQGTSTANGGTKVMEDPEGPITVKPTQPVQPTQPIQSTRPELPIQPVKPDQSAQPSKPTKPAPAKPAKPNKPAALPPLYSGGPGRSKISFLGVDYYVSNDLNNLITLKHTDENSMADAMETLYKSNYKPLIEDLQALRDNDLGNDWALYLFIKQLAETFCGRDESVALRQFLLNNLGYRARVAKVTEKKTLTLLVASDSQIYGVPFIKDSGTKFYDVDADGTYSYLICSKEAPSAHKKVSMSMGSMPRYEDKRKATSHAGKRYQASATVSVPVKLMEFFNRIPQCDYNVYANALVERKFSSQLFDALRPALNGKSEHDAANILLDFVQSGFEYATDPEQFGYEKPFFAEELFYYPSCDCEDRSILYRYLVKNLLGLDVVLLDYPNHIATAVRFNGDEPGDFVMCGGEKYVICDPTFIGAPTGKSMPMFKNMSANILKY